MYLNLGQKVVTITGGASGIGAATAMAFAYEGASVVVADVNIERGEELVSRLQTRSENCIYIPCDVTLESDIKNMIAKTIQRFGRLDCAFNNAGIESETSTTTECTNENWEKTINTNLRSVWWCMKYQIPEMLKNGGGSIVNCASIAGLVGFEGIPAYTASKHGIIGLTQTAALEYAKQNIRVNAICPGVIHTSMIDRFVNGDEHKMTELASGEPMGRMGKPEEIASAVLWLCSNASSFVTGHPLVADGGWVAR